MGLHESVRRREKRPILGRCRTTGIRPADGCRGQQYARGKTRVNDFYEGEAPPRIRTFPADSWFQGGEGIFEIAMDAPSGPPCAVKRAHSAIVRPLTPFEQLMLIDDRPGHRMCFFLECIVDGPLQENGLRNAVETAARRHPLLCSRVSFRKGRPVWLNADVLPTVVWMPPKQSGDPWRPFDLRRESGVRLVVLGDGEYRHRVVLQVHHSVCDGVAACEFVGDVWALYAGVEPRAFSQPRALRRPSSTEKAVASAAANGGKDAAREAWSFARFWPAPLAHATTSNNALAAGDQPGDGSRGDPRSPPYVCLNFDRAFTEQVRATASAGGASLNDSIVAAVMRAAVAWNTRAGRPPGTVRVTMPVNLRQPGQREPANNNLGYAFLDRTAAECTKAQELTTSIAMATRWILDNNAAAMFLSAIHALARWPWLLRLTTRIPICISTVVVSNVGDPSRRMRSGVGRVDGRDAPDELVIQGVFGVPPLRPRTRAAIGVTSYAGRLSLCCLCSAHPDRHEGGRLFLDLIRQELEQFVAAGTAISPALPAP